MKGIKVSITSFIDDHQPGWVECKFHDAHGVEHTVQEKVPIVTEDRLDASSHYPQNGAISCEVIGERKDANGKTIFTVDTSTRWTVETTEGAVRFDVLEEQLTDLEG